MRLILPKTVPDLDEYRMLPLFFLAGPILGGGDWHRSLSLLLWAKVGDCVIVNPSRYTPDHPDYRYKLAGNTNVYQSQTAWERFYLQQVAYESPHGCIIFWLPCEDKANPRMDGKPYAMDTRGEIGEWRGRMMYNQNLRVVLGAEPDFPGLRTIERNNAEALGGLLPTDVTMEDVVDRAIERAKFRSRP